MKIYMEFRSNFGSTQSNFPFLARNTKFLEKEYKITVVNKMLVSNIPKFQKIS